MNVLIRKVSMLLAGVSVVVVCAIGLFLVLEPTVGHTQSTSDEFLVTQTITSAMSFLTNPGDVTMSGTIDGLTGGTAYGTTTARIRTNNATGYNMTIQFSSTTAMGRTGGSGYINNYLYSTSTANYPSGFTTAPANAQFGFTVNASTTSEISSVFTDNGSACGTSNNGSFTFGNCWRGASSTDETFETELINTSGPSANSGSTSTVVFRVTLPSNPVPIVPNGTYVATATLTATEN